MGESIRSPEDFTSESENIEPPQETKLEPEAPKNKPGMSRRNFLKKALGLTAAAALPSVPELSAQEKSTEKQESKEVPEDRQLDIVVLPLRSELFDMTQYRLPIPEGVKEEDERYYKNPVIRAVYEAYQSSEKDERRKKGIYRVGLSQLTTANIGKKLLINKKPHEGSFFEGFEATGAESERLDSVTDEIVSENFGTENRNQNKRIVIIASTRCEPPPLGEKGGQWNDPSLSVDVILVPYTREETKYILPQGSEKLKLWQEFCKKKNGTVEQVVSAASTPLKKDDESKVLYRILSQDLQPRAKEKKE